MLEYLHDQKPDPIVFRDMKPSNVMIDSLGKVRLIDFGIAKTFVSGVKHTMIGTEGYSAPEQYKGDVSPQSDIYSLGATLHHVLTRKDPRLEPPFSFHERPILDYNADVNPGLVMIVEKALSFKAEDRYETCADMKDASKHCAIARHRIAAAPLRGTAIQEVTGRDRLLRRRHRSRRNSAALDVQDGRRNPVQPGSDQGPRLRRLLRQQCVGAQP